MRYSTLVMLNPDIPCLCRADPDQLAVCSEVCEFIATIRVKLSDWLKIRNGHGILIYSAGQGLIYMYLQKRSCFFFFFQPKKVLIFFLFLHKNLCCGTQSHPYHSFSKYRQQIVFDIITTHAPVSAQSSNLVVFRLQPEYFYTVSTSL